MSDYIYGIDVSRYQKPPIEWTKVKNAGKEFVFIKATDGAAYKSEHIAICRQHAEGAGKAGLKTGYYHFARPSKAKGVEVHARREAAFFLETVKTFPKPNFPLVLDYEYDKIALLPKEAGQWISVFQAVVKDGGFELILYSARSYLSKNLPKGHAFGNMPLWLAYYPKNFDVNKLPAIPAGWKSFVMWQYSETGKVDGIPGAKIDLDLMSGDFFKKY